MYSIWAVLQAVRSACLHLDIRGYCVQHSLEKPLGVMGNSLWGNVLQQNSEKANKYTSYWTSVHPDLVFMGSLSCTFFFFLNPLVTIKNNMPLEHVLEGFLPLLSLSPIYCCCVSLLFLLSWTLINVVEDFNISHNSWRKAEIVLTSIFHVTSQFLQHTLLVKPKSLSEFAQVDEQDSTFRLE